MNNIVYLNDYAILNKDNPIGYTYDIYTCIAMLIHRKNSAILAHIESNPQDSNINIQLVLSLLNMKDDEIVFVELFTGRETNKYNLHLVKNILINNGILFDVKSSYIDIYKKGSIGYNFNTSDYYSTDVNYELQRINKFN